MMDCINRSGEAGFTRFWRKVGDLWSVVEPWEKTLKKIEGTSGSGVASYFRLLRTLLYLNLVVAIVFLVFIILPTAGKSHSSQTFHFVDIFLGTGPLQDSILSTGRILTEQQPFPGQASTYLKATSGLSSSATLSTCSP